MLAPGTVFARDFRVVRALAEGGMGAVYVVEQLSTRRPRALKVMLPQMARDPRFRERFTQEAVVSGRIQSDHVVEVIGAGIDETTGIPWLCMELLEGEDLADLMARRGRLTPSEVLEVFRQLCHGLGAAHRAGLVHRDPQPANVFMAAPRREGTPFTVKILDFGIAKVLEESKTSAQATATIGSPLWMAPEQADQGMIRPATDVWPLGLIAFHLFTGRYYWRAGNAESPSLPSLMREVYVDPLEPASYRAASLGCPGLLPPEFDHWFSRCVHRDPLQRYRDASEALGGLASALGASVGATAPGHPGLPPPAPPPYVPPSPASQVTPYPVAAWPTPPSAPTPPPGAYVPYAHPGYTAPAFPPSNLASATPAKRSTAPIVAAIAAVAAMLAVGGAVGAVLLLRSSVGQVTIGGQGGGGGGGGGGGQRTPDTFPNGRGPVGFQMPACRDRHQRADLLGISQAVNVSAGMMHSCAALADGTARCWGMNAQHQLGDGTTEDHYAPTLVSGLVGVSQVAAGQTFSCARRVDGSVWCWGILGRLIERPAPVGGLSGITQLSAGSMHACGVRVDGTAWCWGSNRAGELGDGTMEYRTAARQVVGLVGVTWIEAGGSHTCAALRDGSVWCWGQREHGQLGDGRRLREGRALPAPVPGLSGVAQLAAGDAHTCARLLDGTVRCWGNNENGELGDGTEEGHTTPLAVPGVSGAVDLTAGDRHTCATLRDGSLTCWGQSNTCQLGAGPFGSHRIPTVVSPLPPVATVGAGSMHTCVTLRSGTLRCWGFNHYGQLGNNTASNRPDITSIAP